MILRDYQEAAVQSVYDHFIKGYKGNPLIVAPTGVGKSVIIAGFLDRTYKNYPSQRVMMLVHVKELIVQNYEKLKKAWPMAPAGIYSAGAKRKESHYPITFAGIQSVYNKPELFGHIDLLIIDEAHTISEKENTTYQQFITALKLRNPYLKVIGLTATDFRMGYGRIWGQEDSLFERKCIDLSTMECFNWFIDQGYLVPVIPRRTSTEIDVSGVHLRGGEYNAPELQKAANKQDITIAAIQQCIEECGHLESWLIFCSGVQHAKDVAEICNEMGIECEAVYSGMEKDGLNRDDVLNRFKSGKLKAVANNNVLTTGFDHPALQLIVMLRPTLSAVLWVQMAGRGTRPDYAPGFDLNDYEQRIEAIRQSNKQYCMLYDFSGNTRKLGPINDPVVPRKKGEKGGEAPIKECPSCGTYNHIKVTHCIFCRVEFSFEVKIVREADQSIIIKDELPVIEVFNVSAINCSKNQGKNGKPDSLKVTYYCGMNIMISEFVCLEHPAGSFPRKKAVNWWQDRYTTAIPATVDEALQVIQEGRVPTHIRVHTRNGEKSLKYPEIKAACFDGSAFGVEEAKDLYVEVSVEKPLIDPSLLNKVSPANMDDDVPF